MADGQQWTTDVPSSGITVKISAIDTTMRMHGMRCDAFMEPAIKGFDRFYAGTWCFLIEHPSGRKLLYDLGCRKDWENLPPALGLQKWIDAGVIKSLEAEKNVSEILTEGGVHLHNIEGVIWSHFHFDHTGDPSTFPSSTKLIVGAGTKVNLMPGYPTDSSAHILDSDFAGREVVEVDVAADGLRIGGFKACDWFGDGSFYILDSPGHAVGHLSALARTHASPSPGFVFMCGDTVHHVGGIRPNEHVPLPDLIEPSPVPDLHAAACPAHFFTPVLRDGSKGQHILEAIDYTAGMNIERRYTGINDHAALRDTVAKTERLDGDAEVFTILAHDWSLKGVIDEWPKDLNVWKERGWKTSSWWQFLADFRHDCV